MFFLRKDPKLVHARGNGFNPGVWHFYDFGSLGVYGYGSGGYVSARDRVDVPLPERTLDTEDGRRLAAAMNSFDGFATADITRGLVDRLESSLRLFDYLHPDHGAYNAARLAAHKSRRVPDTESGVFVFDASNHVAAKARDFTAALTRNPDTPFEEVLSHQTYTPADAVRLAAAWNATAKIELETLESGWLKDVVALVLHVARIPVDLLVNGVVAQHNTTADPEHFAGQDAENAEFSRVFRNHMTAAFNENLALANFILDSYRAAGVFHVDVPNLPLAEVPPAGDATVA